MHFRMPIRAVRAGIVLAGSMAWILGDSLFAQTRQQPGVAGAKETAVKEQESDEPPAKAAEQQRLPRDLQRTAVQRIKGKKPEARLEAIRELAEHPCEEAAKILVLQGLTSKFEEVRQASYEALLEFKNNEQVCSYLFDTIKKDMKKGTPRDGAGALLGVVLASDSSSVQKQAEAVLDEAAKQPKGGLLLLVTLADGLGQQGDSTSLATLVKLAKLPLFEQEFAVRRSVVLALANVQELEAVDVLVELLGKLEGEVRGDIVRYLTSISGEQHELDAAAWREWWLASREGFQFPLRGQKVIIARPKPRSMSQQYYGIPIYAKRLVFVIDVSGSMRRGGRIDAAKRELIEAINALPAGVSFNVLAFSERVTRWRKKLLDAAPENKEKAVQFVEQLGLGRATASYDALEAALDLDAEAIYFLTDGAPHGGKVDQPAEIVDVLTRLNHTRRVTINSIGIGVGPEGNLFDTFLKTLSEKNYGEYRRVDE